MGNFPGVRYGRVIDNVDPTGADMISVMLIPEDYGKKSSSDIMKNVFPLLPKAFHVKPKIGEGVFVLLATSNKGESQRYYIGPVISQPHRMYYDAYSQGGDSFQKGAGKDMDVNPYLNEESYGAYPNNDDISIIGRKNCDIHIKDDDIRIQAGVRLLKDTSSYKVVYNSKNPAFIKLKYHQMPLNGDVQSTATIVADKINLLGNKSADPAIDRTDDDSRDELLTDDELNRIMEEGYKLPYGEKLVKLLKKMIKVFNEHTHDFISKPPNESFVNEINNASSDYLSESNPKLLSDTIRIN